MTFLWAVTFENLWQAVRTCRRWPVVAMVCLSLSVSVSLSLCKYALDWLNTPYVCIPSNLPTTYPATYLLHTHIHKRTHTYTHTARADFLFSKPDRASMAGQATNSQTSLFSKVLHTGNKFSYILVIKSPLPYTVTLNSKNLWH